MHLRASLNSLKRQVVMSNPNVPTINLEKAFSDDHQLQLIDSACRDHGFFLIKNHGIQKEIDDMWNMSKWFFSQAVSYTHLTLPTRLPV